MMVDRVERLTNLLALLLETTEPLSLHQIASELSGMYPDGELARRGAFERDKSTLRNIGVPIETTIVSGGPEAGQTRYHVDRSRYEMAALDLADDERRALQLAVAATRPTSAVAQGALWKVGAGLIDDLPPAAVPVPVTEVLVQLGAAVADHCRVTFTYRGMERRVDPWVLLLREGFWYLIGFDHLRSDRRTFRLDRIESDVIVGEPGSFEPQVVDTTAVLPQDPKLIPAGDAPATIRTATVRVAGVRALLLERQLGADAVARRNGDGSVEFDIPFRNLDAFRFWVLGLYTDAVVVGPEDVRADVLRWLEVWR